MIERSDEPEYWNSHLRRCGKRRKSRKKSSVRPDAARIVNRPETIEVRLHIGDFEGDAVLGPPGTGGLVTLIDRKSRYTIIVKVKRKDAEHVHRCIRL